MRAYFLGNYYLSQIQQGIQAQHATSEMFVENPTNEILWDWARNHKTSILLNGGNSGSLDEVYPFLKVQADRFSLPIAKFKEDKVSLNDATTCIGLVLPTEIYEFMSKYRSWVSYKNSNKSQPDIFAESEILDHSPYVDIANLLMDYRLA